MHVVFDDRQLAHNPESHLYGGRMTAAPERASRAQTLLQAAQGNGLQLLPAIARW